MLSFIVAPAATVRATRAAAAAAAAAASAVVVVMTVVSGGFGGGSGPDSSISEIAAKRTRLYLRRAAASPSPSRDAAASLSANELSAKRNAACLFRPLEWRSR